MKNKNKSNNKVANIIKVATILIVLGLIFSLSDISFTVNDGFIPPIEYTVKINRLTRKVVLKEYHSCSYVDCVPEESKISFVLTKEDYDLVRKIKNKYGNEKNLNIARALSYLSKGEEEFYLKDDLFYEEKEDLNKDGVITYEESGRYILELIVEDKKKNLDN